MIPGLGQAVPTVSWLSFKLKPRYPDRFQATFSAPTITATVAVHELQANSEWRFEVAIGQKIEVRVGASMVRFQFKANMFQGPLRNCRNLRDRARLEPRLHIPRNEILNIHMARLPNRSYGIM